MIDDNETTELKREIKELREQIEQLSRTIKDLSISVNKQGKKSPKLKVGSKVKLLTKGRIGRKGDVGVVTNCDIGKAFIHIELSDKQIAARKEKNIELL